MWCCRLPNKFFCALLSALPFSPLAQSAVVDDVVGSRDLRGFERYPESGIIRYSEQAEGRYIYALGKVKRVSGSWRPEEEGQASGVWTSLTYRAPDRKSSQAVYAHFRQQLQALGAEPLYACSGRACGPSNQWANLVFSEKLLYGPDGNQRYFAGRLGDTVLTLYVIKRGNRRVYARLDQVVLAEAEPVSVRLETPTAVASSWLTSLQQQQRAVILDTEPNALRSVEAELEQLAAWLQGQQRSLRIVGHRYGDRPLDELRERSRVAANELSKRLIALGVPSAQIEVFGLGSLAPGDLGRDRIVLLLE